MDSLLNFAQTTDLEERSQKSFTASWNGFCQSWNSNWDYSGFWWPHTQKQAQTKCIPYLHLPCCVLHIFILKLRPQQIQVTYAPDDSGILITGKTWIPPIENPYWEENGAKFWISSLNLWLRHSCNETSKSCKSSVIQYFNNLLNLLKIINICCGSFSRVGSLQNCAQTPTSITMTKQLTDSRLAAYMTQSNYSDYSTSSLVPNHKLWTQYTQIY